MNSVPLADFQTDEDIQCPDKKIQDFETWLKGMNYKLFLEHAHSSEYYKQRTGTL